MFQVPDLSKTVKVSASGEIAMPLIGTVQAGGKTVVAARETEIKTKLEAKYLQSAQVSVFVKEAISQQVTVDGAVKNPGMVTLDGPTTLLQTIAFGRARQGANPRGIVVFRTVDQKRMAAKFDLAAIRSRHGGGSGALWRRHRRGRQLGARHALSGVRTACRPSGCSRRFSL